MKKIVLLFTYFISLTCYGQIGYKYFTKTEIEQDLDFFYEKLTSIHPLFLNKDIRNEWDNTFVVLKGSIKDSLTQNEFYILAASYLAMLNDGHSFFRMPYDQRIQYVNAGGRAFPFFVEIKDNSIFVSQYNGDDSTLFTGGEEILQINGVNSADMIEEMQKLFGARTIAIKQKLIANNFRFYIWMIYGFEKDYEMMIKNKSNQTVKLSIPGITSEQFMKNKKRFQSVKNKLYAFSIDKPNKTCILKISSFADLEGLCAFADSAFSAIAQNNIKNLIIDIRGNGGGRSIVGDSLMNYLTNKEYSQYRKIEIRVSNDLKERYKNKYPESFDWLNSFAINDIAIPNIEVTKPLNNKLRFSNNMFLLTDMTTGSAAVSFAGVFRELRLGPIIGEETGGSIEDFGDYWDLQTPNTKVFFSIAPKKYTMFGGTEPDRGIIPDYLIVNKGDSIINFTKELIEKQSDAIGG